MSIICMAVYDTEENGRTEYTRETLHCLMQTVNMARHTIHVIDNASCKATKILLDEFKPFIQLQTLGQNIGTARAINKAWELREGQHAIKMDNDVVIHLKGWADELEDVVNSQPDVGIVGLKRKDLAERPDSKEAHYRSSLSMTGGNGKPWVVLEDVKHVMGTCQMYNSKLLDKIGFLHQPGIYGFDDSLAAIRCTKAGFRNCFLPHIDIDHIDTGASDYSQHKRELAGEGMAEFNRLREGYQNGTLDIYHGMD